MNSLISLLLINAALLQGQVLQKCCKSGEYLKQTSSEYGCAKDESKRLQIVTNETDFLSRNESGECVDATASDFFVFNVKDTRVFASRIANGNFFPKCCPLNSVYNQILHSCEEKENMTHSYIKESFVKVGLTNCKVVVDYELNGTLDFEYKLINMTERTRNYLHYPNSYCIDATGEGIFIIRECKESIEVCENVKCVKKCCPDGQSFINGAKCYDTYKHGLNLSTLANVIDNPEDPYAIIYNRTCPKIYKMTEQDYNFTLNNQGVFSYYVRNTKTTEDIGNMNSYCIEYSEKPNAMGYFFFMCFPEKENVEKYQYTFWALLFSCVFLLITIFIYIILNEIRKMFGKILVNYCIATLFQYAVLTYAQANLKPTAINCQLRAFSIIFFATASFTWANIMCWDIWCTFGSTKRYVGSKQRKMALKKLLLYCFYGWGAPIALTLVIFIFYIWRVLPDSIQPYLAEVRCFFDFQNENYAKALFFNFPLLIIQFVNMVLFIRTVIYCWKVKDEINRINDTTKYYKRKTFQGDKDRLFLILKLLVIMGISFIFEVISAFFEMNKMGNTAKYIEIVWDTINALQGVFIFIIFICKKKILQGLLQKLRLTEISHLSNTSSLHTQSSLTLNGVAMSSVGVLNKSFT